MAVLVLASCATEQKRSEKVKVLFAQGRQALVNSDIPKARKIFEECLSVNSNSKACRWELGYTYFYESRWEDALSEWDKMYSKKRSRAQEAKSLVGTTRVLSEYRKLSQLLLQKQKKHPPDPEKKSSSSAKQCRLRIRAGGDVMLGSSVPSGELPPSSEHVIGGMKPWLQDADLTLINLEGPLCNGGESAKCKDLESKSCYAFRSPTDYGRSLFLAGVDFASLANNHSNDFGPECSIETQNTLDHHNIAWSGPKGSYATLRRMGKRIAIAAFHAHKTTNNIVDLKEAATFIKTLSKDHEIVIVSFHGGAEGVKALRVPDESEMYFNENRGHLRKFARTVIDAGADLVIGHGPHVLRGMEIYKKRLIAYSLGNFMTYGRFNLSGYNGVTAVLEAETDCYGRLQSGKILSAILTEKGIARPDPQHRAAELMRVLSALDFADNSPVIDEDGSFVARQSGNSPLFSEEELATLQDLLGDDSADQED